MKNFKYKFLWLQLVCLILSSLSCTKFITVDPPVSLAEQDYIFADNQSAVAATVGLYQQMVNNNLSFANGGLTIYTALLADELQNVNVNPNYDPFTSNTLNSTNDLLNQTFWINPYKNIYQANAVLEGLEKSTQLSTGTKAQLSGEVLYIRALHYFYLVNLYGDVPLVCSTDYEQNATLPRTAAETVWIQIIADLVKARALLKDITMANNTRPSYAAATALLARVYLYQHNWDGAEKMATEIITTGKYTLEPLAAVFLATSKEAIFGISKQTGNTAEGSVFLPSSALVKPTFALRADLLAAFTNTDNRKNIWLKSNIITGQAYFYPEKYKVKTSTTVTEYYIIQRYAEMFLIRAEANVWLAKLPQAIDDLDQIRRRAGLLKIADTNPLINKTDLLDLILKERQLEFFTEWGHRWFDLKRTDRADEVLKKIKGTNWQKTDEFLPIPLSQMLKNPFLTQNNGY